MVGSTVGSSVGSTVGGSLGFSIESILHERMGTCFFREWCGEGAGRFEK